MKKQKKTDAGRLMAEALMIHQDALAPIVRRGAVAVVVHRFDARQK